MTQPNLINRSFYDLAFGHIVAFSKIKTFRLQDATDILLYLYNPHLLNYFIP